MAFDGTLKFDTALDEEGFQSGLDSLGELAQKGLEAVKGLAEKAGEAILTLGKNAVASGQSFEKSMSNVIATMGVTKDTIQDGENVYEKLKQAAADAGKTTAFSATQASDALNFLALAGYSATQAVDTLPAVLDLAAAGNMALADASNLATNAMSALGIEAGNENLTNFGDKMAKTASKANTSVAQLGEAITTVGGTANQLAGGVTELDALVGVLANRGIFASEAGTHIRNVILALLAPTDKAKAKLDELGVTATTVGEDGAEHLRPLNEIFSEMAGASVADLNEIFRVTDLTAVQGFIAGCGEEFDNLTSAIDDSDGAMSQMAETMLDNLAGDKTILDSAVEGFYNAVYDGMNSGLREIVQLATTYVSQLTDAFENGGFEGLAQKAGDVLGDAVTKISGYLPKIVKIGTSLVSSLLKGLSENAGNIAKTGIQIALELIKGIGHILAEIPDFATELVQTLADSFSQNQAQIQVTLKTILNLLARSLTENIQPFADAVLMLVSTIGEIILFNLPVLTDAGFRILETLAQALIDNLDTIIQAGFQLIQALSGALLNGDNLEKLLDAGIKILLAVTDAIVDNLDTLIDVAIQIAEFLVNELLTQENIGKLLDAGKKILEKIWNGIIDNIDDILLAVETIISTLCDDLLTQENIDTLIDEGAKLLGEIINGLCQVTGKLLGFAGMLFKEIATSLAQQKWHEMGVRILEGIISGMTGVDFTFDDFISGFSDNWKTGYKELGLASTGGSSQNGSSGGGYRRSVGQTVEDMEEAVNAFRLQSANVFGNAQSSPTSQIANNYYSNIQNSNTSNSQQGDIIIPFYLEGEQIQSAVITALQIENLRSGGGFV